MPISAMRPMSAGSFTSKEYEDAKRRVQRLSAATDHQAGALPAVNPPSVPLPPSNVEGTRGRVRPASAPRARDGGRGGLHAGHPRIAFPAESMGVQGGARVVYREAEGKGGTENQDSNKQDRQELPRRGGEGGRAANFMDTLQRNIMDLKDCIGQRLESSPHVKKVLDADFKELQLHLDRLIIHAHTERDRHAHELSKIQESHKEELAMIRSEQEAEWEEAEARHAEQLKAVREEERQRREEAEHEHAQREDSLRAAMKEQREAQEMRVRQLSDLFKESEREARQDLEAAHAKQVDEVREELGRSHRRQLEAAEEEKSAALKELAEELIPQVEAELLEAHRKEISQYHRKQREAKKRMEALAKEAEQQVQTYRRRTEEVEATMAAREEDARRQEEALREQGRGIGALERKIADAEGALTLVVQAVAAGLHTRDEAVQKAARERAEAMEALAQLQEQHMDELNLINVRVRRVVEAKEREKGELGEQLRATQKKLTETEEVLLAQQREVQALSGDVEAIAREAVHAER